MRRSDSGIVGLTLWGILACCLLMLSGCASPPASPPTQRANAEVHIRRASAWRKAGKPATSRSALVEAVRIADAFDNRAMSALAHNELGVQAYHAGRMPDALAYFAEALDQAEAASEMPQVQLAAIVANVGCAQVALGHDELARGSYERASGIYRKAGSTAGESRAAVMLSEIELRQGDTSAARKLAARALAGFRQSGDAKGVATAEHNIGAIAVADGQLQLAREHYEQAATLFRQVEHPPGLVNTYRALAQLASGQGESDTAERMWRKVLAVARANRYIVWHRQALEHLAEIAAASGDVERAAGYESEIERLVSP